LPARWVYRVLFHVSPDNFAFYMARISHEYVADENTEELKVWNAINRSYVEQLRPYWRRWGVRFSYDEHRVRERVIAWYRDLADWYEKHVRFDGSPHAFSRLITF